MKCISIHKARIKILNGPYKLESWSEFSEMTCKEDVEMTEKKRMF